MANTYKSITGKEYTQRQINSQYSRARKGFIEKYICECCQVNTTNDPDHTISRKRCKELNQVELIWNEANISWSCRNCHNEWESYKSGNFSNHYNAYDRMIFTGIYDKEGFIKRYLFICNDELEKKLKNLYHELLEN